MPWNECKPMDERLKFVGRFLSGEKMAPLCHEFGISRVTDYKIINRHKEVGLDALYDRSCAPYRQANRLPFQVERTLLGIKKEHPSWGAPKIRDQLIRQYPMIKPPSFNFLHQQQRFDTFVGVYHNQRPHQALGGAYPGDVYTPSARTYEMPAEPDYPWHDRTIRVTRCGRICIGKRKINFSTVFAGQLVGIREVEDQIWLVSFMDYDLGYFDNERGRVEPGPNPFVPDKVLTMCPE